MARDYTRTFIKTTGQTIVANDFNVEFQLIDDAFSHTTGHRHNGSTNEGSFVPLISDTNNYTSIEIDEANEEIDFNINVASAKIRQLYLQAGALVPETDNAFDLGTSLLEFKDLYLDGTAYIDNLDSTGATSGQVLTADGAGNSAWQDAAGGGGGGAKTVNTQTATYTLQLSDANNIVYFTNGTAATVRIPEDTTTNFPIGTVVDVVRGSATISASPLGGVTVRRPSDKGASARLQYSVFHLVKIAADLWYQYGDLGAAE